MRHLRLILVLVLGASSAGSPVMVAQGRSGHAIAPVLPVDLLRPAGQEWLTYHGDYSGRHFSAVDQITTRNVGRLKRAWVSGQPDIAGTYS